MSVRTIVSIIWFVIWLIMFIGGVAVGSAIHQLFIDTKGNSATGYGPNGADVLYDANLNGDVDLCDFAEFQRRFTGPS